MVLENLLNKHSVEWPVRGRLETLQVNMGRLCNMKCAHCHVNAAPGSKDVMPREMAEKIVRFLFRYHIKNLDITGGAPEMVPSFEYLAETAKDLVEEIIVRCNLTVLFEDGMDGLPDFYKKINAHLICSLPCYTKENVDKQRGEGAFDKSIKALKILNDKDYGKDSNLRLDLVYNPGGAFLPGSQKSLEADYKRVLGEKYGITFDRLLTITNMPINRFNSVLRKGQGHDRYLALLADRFNPSAMKGVMCRNLLSIGWDGRVYDCDFNQALDMPLTDEKGNPVEINSLDPESLAGAEIRCADHCLGCLAGEGSSCSGALI